MSKTATDTVAEHVITILREHEAELREAGIRRLPVFGSVARNEARPDSDIDGLIRDAVECCPGRRCEAAHRLDVKARE